MTIVRVRREGFNSHGNPIAGETRTTLTNAFVAPRHSNDVDDRGREGVIVGLSLFGDYGTDLLSTDEIEVDGVLYRVDGDPGQWKSGLTGWEPGFEVSLVRAAG